MRISRRLFLFSAHLAISFLILCVLMYLIFFVWYPHSLFFTSGGWQGTKIVFFVDMVLGPSLTLILSSASKPKGELIRDLCFCALVQIGALIYGLSLIIDTKPSVLSIHAGAIHAIQNYQIENLPDRKVFDEYPNNPPLIYSDDINRYDLSIPEYNAKAKTVVEFGREYGVPVHAVPATFDLISNRSDELAKLTARSLEMIKENSNYDQQQLKSVSNKNWFVVEMDGSFKDGYLAFDEEGMIHESICCH